MIEGFSKGAGYRPGAKFKSGTFRNQWTSVWVENGWRFINCKWGARHVRGPRDSKMTYQCDEFYFLTDPKEHIYQHFPDDSTWQLLQKPLTMDEFIHLPVVKSPFFNNKLSFCRSPSATMEAHDGLVEVRIKSPKLLPFAAKLKSKIREVPQDILHERTLLRSVDSDMAIHVNLPSPGNYYLDVYVANSWNIDSMDNACSFQIHCSGVSRDANISYPQVGTFGKTPYFLHYGMNEETHPDPYIVSNGESTLAFGLKKNIKISYSLKRWDIRDRTLSDYDRHAILKHRSDTFATFIIHCPRRGNYVFTTYATDAEGHDEDMKCVHRYFIECKSPMLDAAPMPKASRRWKHCKLVEPLTGDLPLQTEVKFKIESKRAVDISVVINDQWLGLEANGRVWQGRIYTGHQPGKAMVYGRFDANSEKYIPLLEYRIKDKQKTPFV